jgi:hypothetical protein
MTEYDGVKIYVGDLSRCLGISRRYLRSLMEAKGSKIPPPDGNTSEAGHFGGTWWWVNTLRGFDFAPLRNPFAESVEVKGWLRYWKDDVGH